MQIHYAIKFSEPDHTSITVKMTSKKPKYFAGIYLLVKGWFPIPPGKKESNADINCRINADPPLHVFAFRPHAHTLGRVSFFPFDQILLMSIHYTLNLNFYIGGEVILNLFFL